MKTIITFCNECRHCEVLANVEPCRLCLEYGLRWGAPVCFERNNEEEEDAEKR